MERSSEKSDHFLTIKSRGSCSTHIRSGEAERDLRTGQETRGRWSNAESGCETYHSVFLSRFVGCGAFDRLDIARADETMDCGGKSMARLGGEFTPSHFFFPLFLGSGWVGLALTSAFSPQALGAWPILFSTAS